nr:hypothetical protein [Lachnospiraceae bacterium]
MSAYLNSVYNNYLSGYAPKELTRFDAHNKRELRDTCNSIIKLNKDSPLYLPVTNKDIQQYIVDIKDNARNLKNTISKLGVLDDKTIFARKSAYSSDTDCIVSSFVGSDEDARGDPSYLINVSSLATAQQNTGSFLKPDALGIPPDTYSFDVALNDMNYELQFTVTGQDTNKTVQERLKRLINNSSIGLKASVMENDENYALVIESDNTGKGPLKDDLLFSITDDKTSKKSGAVDYFGLDNVTRAPENAKLSINGEARESSSNKFTLGKVYDIELKEPTTEEEQVIISLKT